VSLVNDMLRDLEHRRSDAPAVEFTWIDSEKKSPVVRRVIMALVFIVVVIGAYVGWLMLDFKMPTENAIKIPDSPSAVAVVQPAKPVAVVPPVIAPVLAKSATQLMALSEESNFDSLTITLQFDAKINYETQSQTNGLRLRFTGVRQSADIMLPVVPADVATLQLIDEGNALVLTLQTRNAVSYQLRRVDDKTIVIALSGLPNSDNSVNNSTANDTMNAPQAEDIYSEPSNDVGESAQSLPNNSLPPVAMSNVVDVKQARDISPAQRDKQVARQAKNDLRNGNRQAAREALSSYVEQYPEYARESGYLLASMMLENREQNAAIFLIKNLRNELPDDVPLRQLQAQAMIANDQLPQTVKFLQEVTPPIATYSSYYEVLAAAAQKNGDSALAAKTYERLLTVDSRRGDWWIGYAIAADASNQKNNATQAFARALNDPQLTPALRQYARQRLGMPVN
jgi:Flp pilus assembly protein TadD